MPAAKFPEASRLTIVEAVLALVAALAASSAACTLAAVEVPYPYPTLRDQFGAGGVTLRPNKSVSSGEVLRQRFKNSAPPPYGFCYLEGRLQKDPREFPILQIIERQWRQGKNPTSIARYLNERMLKPRKGQVWKQPTVFYIVQLLHQQSQNSNHHEVRP